MTLRSPGQASLFDDRGMIESAGMHGEASIGKAFTGFARNRDLAFAAELHRMLAQSRKIGEFQGKFATSSA